MSKEKKSKLDQFAERLDGWFGVEKKTISEVQKELALDGCSVSAGRLSEWWAERQRQHMQQSLLAQISIGANQVKEVEQAWGKNPPPELSTLIKLHRTLIWKLTTAGNVDPELLGLVSGLMKSAMEFDKLVVKKSELELTRQKFQRETCELFLKWSADQKAREVAGSNLSYADKIEQLGQTMFPDSWK
ncbi:MAG: hypothetical protein KGH75_12280 [Rhodospirillales bacterium]|nr:hypothetical protein [Rhodospirillales bacterium]